MKESLQSPSHSCLAFKDSPEAWPCGVLRPEVPLSVPGITPVRGLLRLFPVGLVW